MLLQLDKAPNFQSLDWHGFNRLPAEEELLIDASAFVSAMADLLSHLDSVLLSFTFQPRNMAVAILPWYPGPRVGTAVDFATFGEPMLREASALAVRHGRALCAILATRWPDVAMPPVIGIVTDGHGVAISQDHPSAMDPLWLLDHVGGVAPASAIIPFDAAAAWQKLCDMPRSQQH